MKRLAGVTVALLGWLVVSFGWPPGVEAQPRTVGVQLDWVISGYHSGFFVAKEKGLYAAKGLDVTLNRGYGSADAIKVAAAGKTDFAFADTVALIISRGKGVPVKGLAVVIGKSPQSILSFEGKGIRKITDVEGKSFADAPGGANIMMWPAFAKLAGIDVNKVPFVATEAAAKPAAFFGGRVDWVIGYRPAFDEIVVVRARKEGKKLLALRWEDVGWKVYGQGIVARDEVVDRDPKLVADFVEATLDGYRWAIENPEQALDIFVKANPEVDRAVAHLSLMYCIESLLTPAGKEHGLGYMDPDRMAFQIDLMSKLNNFPPPKAAEVYTNQFIQKRPVKVSPALEAELAKIR